MSPVIGWEKSASEAGIYIATNFSLIRGAVDFSLPGWFENNPYGGAVNGSLWTLPWEIRMYFLLAAAAYFSFKYKKLTILLILAIATPAEFYFVNQSGGENAASIYGIASRFIFFFFAGASIFAWLPDFRGSLGLSLAICAIGGALMLLSPNSSLPYAYYMCAVPFLVLTAGLSSSNKPVLKSISKTDISYGLYLYAFPLQQAVVAVFPTHSPLQVFMVAALATAIAAYLSYKFVEHPALEYKAVVFKSLSAIRRPA